MRILANENFPRLAITALRSRGHDVKPSPMSAAEKVVATLEGRTDWLGHFSVIEDSRIRMRKLPRRASSN